MNPNQSAVGTVLNNRYTLTARTAVGGMGEVWAATDTVLRRTVAVKLMHPALGQEQDFVERFRAEARHTAALHHPNITTVYDYGEDGGASYLVMELVAGQPLSQLISERAPLGAQETASILRQAASALAAAHHGGVVHRDVKPANILVTPCGTVKLTDFGISRAVGAAAVTQPGQVFGTAQYLSPEQALGQGATAASDIYALGVVGHQMLTGQCPFEAGSPVATALAQVNQPPPPLPETVPAAIRDVISACLAKDPADRPASADAVAAALAMPGADLTSGAALPAPGPAQTQEIVTAQPAKGPPGIRDRGVLDPRPGRRGAAWLLGAAAALLVAVLGIFVVLSLSPDSGGPGTPDPAATTPASSPSPTPSTSTTTVIAPPQVASPVPRRPDNKGKGNRRDNKKGK